MSGVTACRQQKGHRIGARYAEVAAVRRPTAVIVVSLDESLNFPNIVL